MTSRTARGVVEPRIERVLASACAGERGGPLLLVTVGIHGNEPAGLHAMRRVLRDLSAARVPLAGRLAAFTGNRAGLARNVRYVDEDMNRLWSRQRIDDLRTKDPLDDSVEQREQRELLALVEAELEPARDSILHLDLHSTSGGGPPFTIVAGPTERREAARALRVPQLLGFDSVIAGTLIEYVGSFGHPAVVLEGGQNESPATIDHHEAAIWVALAGTGVVREREVPDLERHVATLARAGQGLPREVEVEHCHHLEPGEEFRMLDGYRTFSRVAEGELLAHAGPGLAREVRAPWSGILIMPRYQGQGLDGFFLGRERRGPRTPAVGVLG